MENIVLTLESKNQLKEYVNGSRLSRCEQAVLDDILVAIEKSNCEQLDWFDGFGNSIRSILMNVHAYRKGLEFGFSEIAFDKYGWLSRRQFLDAEDIKLDASVIHLGRGINNIWTYGMNHNFGLAGGGYGLSVYGKQFQSRKDALACALAELKQMMTDKIGDSDTSNYKQPTIIATIKAIDQQLVGLVQLSLF
ncbi:MAG: hypothetical protein M3O71_10185 [Bacteroidota bacterium]|nr:hypothetical protein [Bacteroidota bacterium]